MKQAVSLVQPNFQQGPKELNSYYLPYSAGVLWAYAAQFPEITESFYLDQIIWQRLDLDKAVRRLSPSAIVGFSTYVWNRNYNFTLAGKLKKEFPHILIVFGGPEVPVERPDIFDVMPFADIVVKTEGERAFYQILTQVRQNGGLAQIPGLLLNRNGERIDTGPAQRIDDLTTVPSPYLTGVFADLIQKHPEVEWNATLESNRGCPYACTFCDWGSLTYNKVKLFDMPRVLGELAWMAQHRCGYVSIADANFGMFIDRDSEIVNWLLAQQAQTGYPYTVSMSWAKNQKSDVIALVEQLATSPAFNQGLSLSVQSLNEDVLGNIKRKNLDMNRVEDIFALCDRRNIPVYTELILGLPGETLSSWKEGVWKLFRANNHNGVVFHQAQLLENAEMNLFQKRLFGIESVPVVDYMSGSYNADTLREKVNVVVATRDMPATAMLDALMFNWFVVTFHINGLTTYISRFLQRQAGVDYAEFYMRLEEWMLRDPWLAREYAETLSYYQRWTQAGEIAHPTISNVEIHGWNLVHRTTLNIIAEGRLSSIFALIDEFVAHTWPEVPSDIVEFQRLSVIDYNRLAEYPIRQQFNSSFLEFIQQGAALDTPAAYLFEFNDDPKMSRARFLENIYFGRRRNFGKAIVNNDS